MIKVVDARGLACPQPVILTRKAMAESAAVTTIVDSETSRDNVRRMAEKHGRRVLIEEVGDEFHLQIVAEGVEVKSKVAAAPDAPLSGSLVLVVPDKKMGRGDELLGEILIRGFFHTLGEIQPLPEKIIFFNAGVWLTVDDSPILDDLQALEGSGITILACGTCLNHFGIVDRLAVGTVSNMYDIAETMLAAARVVCL